MLMDINIFSSHATMGVSHVPCQLFFRIFKEFISKKTTFGFAMAQQQSGDEEVGKEKPAGIGGAGTRKHGRTGLQWRDVDVLPVGPNNVEKIRQRHGVRDGGSASVKFIYFRCRHRSAGCKFTMRWTKQSGLLQQHGQHNHALLTPAKKVDWKDVDTLLPVGPINVQEVIKQRHGVVRNGDRLATVFYFRCRHYSAGCKFTMRWTKQGGLLQQHGRHNHAVTQNEDVGEQEEEDGTGTNSGEEEEEEVSTEEEEDDTGTESGGEEEDMPTVKREEVDGTAGEEEEMPAVKREKDGTGTNTGGEEEEVRIVKYLQRDYKCLGPMVLEGEEKPSKESMPVHTIQEEDEEEGMDMEEGTSQATGKKKKLYRYTQRQLPGPVKKEEPGAEEAEEAEEEAPPPPQMPRIAIVVPQWLLQPHQPVEVAQPAKMLLRERKRRIDYGE